MDILYKEEKKFNLRVAIMNEELETFVR